jgi:hypothetical protein
MIAIGNLGWNRKDLNILMVIGKTLMSSRIILRMKWIMSLSVQIIGIGANALITL